MEPILDMKGITKRFVGVTALDDVSFSCLPGEVHVLVGENGAGKSTLLKILTGVHTMDAGTIRIGGKEVHFHKPAEARRAGIAMVYQELSVLPQLTVAQNIYLNLEKRAGMTKGVFTREGHMRQEVLALAARYGIELDPYALAGDLPIAKQQMVEILKVLVQNPDIIILDEPTSALAREEVDKLYEIVMQMQAEGKTIIFISHRMEEVFRFGNRATVLKDGCVVDTIPLEGCTEEDLVRMMVGRDFKDIFPAKQQNPGGKALFTAQGLTLPGVLNDVSFEVREGEVLGIAGLQGHGQSELLSAIAGVLRTSQGSMTLHGKPLHVTNPAQGIAAGIGYIPEDRKTEGLMLSLSIRDNLSITSLGLRKRYGFIIDRKRESQFVEDNIKALKIRTHSALQPVESLSGGNQQKVVLGKGIAKTPKLLLFNEPTRGIDVGAKQEFYNMMRNFASQGVAVIMYSSDLLEVVGMSDRVLAMYEGRITSEICGESITEEAIMMAAVGLGEEGGKLECAT